MAGFRAGYAATSITPPLGTPMAGLFHHREAWAVEDDLHAKAIVLNDGKTTLAMVVCDIISIPKVLSDLARDLIEKRTGLAPSNVMISGTHTHTGPLIDAGWRLFQDRGGPQENAEPGPNGMIRAVLDPGYVEWLARRIADAVSIAHRNLTPARMAAGKTTIEHVCFNRRYHMKDGTVIFNPGFQNPDIVEVAGPTDPELITTLLESTDGQPIALWSTLSLHYVGTDEERTLSADYYGHFGREIEQHLGCGGVLANGTSGNINNVDVARKSLLTGSAKARQVAKAVAAAAIASVMSQQRTEDVQLAASTIQVQLERYPVTESDVAIATAVMEGDGSRQRLPDERYSFETGQRLPEPVDFVWANEVLRLSRLPGQDVVEVQVFAIGSFAIVALPGEIFVEFGLDAKQRSPYPTTAIISMSNQHHGYIPNRAAFAQGGYETFRSRMNWTAPGSGERLIDAAIDALHDLHGAPTQ